MRSVGSLPTFTRKGGAMESVTRFVDRHSGALPATSTQVPAATQTLAATASYLLSEDGRKASLLADFEGGSFVESISSTVCSSRSRFSGW